MKAPIKKGDIVGKLIIKEGDDVTRESNVTVIDDVKGANIIELYFRYLKETLVGDFF